MPLINDTDAYKRWAETPVPLRMKFHFFNVKNADNYSSLDDIEFEEKGPYVYHEKRFKQNVEDHGELISYRENKTYTFQKEGKEGLDESDELTIVNFPVLVKFLTFKIEAF